ncbi:class I SAM-dependent DNA methyltransferase [Planomicrobium okeanokoites]|uniref:class I SAM-dependent DNA methyltransferase n=1 Tax=Planomicrobium okeanokoites TaxID=244 RepID=UPI000A00ECC6|nr:class I SAM-dependent methyltransferase [Planomicrobium okeanokoites]
MEYRGSLVYEEQDFLESYLKRRSRPDSPNNAIEGPIINGFMNDLKDAHILDLGCGDGRYGKELLKKGAKAYTGVEGSAAMVNLAKTNLYGTRAEVIHSSIEKFEYPEMAYEIVISRMALHYIEDLDEVFKSIAKTLKEGARFIFSVQHPVTTASFKSKSGGERRNDWVVDDYFEQGARNEPWIGKNVVKYHRTIENYFSSLILAGFHIHSLKEGQPEKANFTDPGEFERRKRIPVILAFSCGKGESRTK